VDESLELVVYRPLDDRSSRISALCSTPPSASTV